MGFSRQEYWSGLPCCPPGDRPSPGIKPESLLSPALANRFFTTSAPCEAPIVTVASLYCGSYWPGDGPGLLPALQFFQNSGTCPLNSEKRMKVENGRKCWERVRRHSPALRVSVGRGPWAPNQPGSGHAGLGEATECSPEGPLWSPQRSYLPRGSLETRLRPGAFIGPLSPSVICRADLAVPALVVRRRWGGVGWGGQVQPPLCLPLAGSGFALQRVLPERPVSPSSPPQQRAINRVPKTRAERCGLSRVLSGADGSFVL